MSEEMKVAGAKVERPGCVSAYAILLWISSGLGLIALLCTLSGVTGIVEARLGVAELVLAGIGLLFTAIYVVIGIGLWQMKKWGWALVIVTHTLSLIGGLLSLFGGLFVVTESEWVAVTPYLCGALINLAVNGLILYWFITNRGLFNGGTEYKSVVGADGEIRREPVKKTSDATTLLAVAGGLVLVLILVCIVVIAMLAVLGPQIGNVFSQITFTLENSEPAIVPWLW